MKQINRIKGQDETLDSFYHGRIRVLQKKKGYRFSVDSPLLADFIRTEPRDEILDLGAGNGIISLLLSIKPFQHITAVEIQQSLADLARRNVSLNKLGGKITVINQDLRAFNPLRNFDVIFSNPPYIQEKQGQLSSQQEKSIAKHELKCNIFDIMHKTSELLKRKGRAYFVFPAKRGQDFREALHSSGLKMKARRLVKPRPEEAPHWFLAECGFLSPQEIILPPLVLFNERGGYTPEVKEIFSGRIYAPAT
ncbi:MAG: tRNA1(Val) (adenine(37)-N6)-methyltransferase [Candidatus Aminicenantes bacterium]